MNLRFAIIALLGLLFTPVVKADEARLLRFPATDGRTVAFSYAGDIYTVPLTGGTARRLTSHEGYEVFARYSPDGRTIAFTGQYDGNTEVYTMPAEGGEPQRITYTATNARDDMGDRMGPNNIAMTFTPDGREVIYRNRISDGFTGKLWAAPLDGALPRELPLPEGGFCSYSPDGRQLAYNRVFREFRTWKYYKGGMADDIWIYDFDSKTTRNITDNVAQDICPMWIGHEIYYISDRDKRMNIFVYNTTTGTTSKVTDFTDYDVKFPSCGGGVIVFEKGGYLYKLDPASKQAERISISLNAEGIYARNELRPVADDMSDASLSADGTRVAVTARGEVFDVPVKKGVTRCVSHTPGANERKAKYSPVGSDIAYISDRGGESGIWLQQPGKEPRELTKGNIAYITDFRWSPDGKQIVWADRANRLGLIDVAAGSYRILATDPEGRYPCPKFSPDGRWLTYTREAPNQHNVVYIYEIATGTETPVTESWYDSTVPVFSTDGRYLLFASARDFNPIYSAVEWNFAYRNMESIYICLLSADTPSPFLPKDGEASDADTAAAPISPIIVDTDGLAERVVKIPLESSNYGYIHCDGSSVWYYGNGGTHVYDLKEQKDELVAAKAVMELSADERKALYTKSGSLYVTAAPSGKMELSEPVDLSGMLAEIDYPQEWQQIYNEAWRAYRDGFYLENMHGVDWQAIREKYAVLLPYVKNRLDLTYVIGAMISELACGHAYVDGGDHVKPSTSQIGMLGARLSRSGDAFRIDHIIKGAPDRATLHSPLAEPGLGIKEGDYITAVDGVPTATVNNIYRLLRRKAGVATELTIAADATGKGARKVVVTPIADEYPLYHYEWIQRNIKHVADRTDGRVGYIYIPDMGPEGLREFARYFFPQIDKEALIIDDRGNGGGNISPMIIERLLRQPYRMTMYRGTTRNGTVPEMTHYGPKVLLVNKYSASDGDLFPWSFKANKIGTVIGTRSWGGIIGITSSLPYMDGTNITIPFFTNYDAATGRWIVENHGVDPDILIDNDPAEEWSGTDRQLDAAIDEILRQLPARKPLPATPAPRTLPDLGVPLD